MDHFFTRADGDWPLGLLLADDGLYGVTEAGGENDTGTLFPIKTDGSDFTVLRHFDPVDYPYSNTNYSGVNPEGALPAGILKPPTEPGEIPSTRPLPVQVTSHTDRSFPSGARGACVWD